MKTLIVASSFIKDTDGYMFRTDRTERWANFNRHWGFDGLLIHNPVEGFQDHDKQILPALTRSWYNCKHHIMNPMIRGAGADTYPNWMTFEVLKSYLNNYERIFYIDTDAFALSEKFRNYMLSLTTGWTAFWTPKYNFPENGIMVICKDQFEKYKNLNFLSFNKQGIAEKLMPYTLVNKDFNGDRFQEFLPNIPENADYAVQVRDLAHEWLKK